MENKSEDLFFEFLSKRTALETPLLIHPKKTRLYAATLGALVQLTCKKQVARWSFHLLPSPNEHPFYAAWSLHAIYTASIKFAYSYSDRLALQSHLDDASGWLKNHPSNSLLSQKINKAKGELKTLLKQSMELEMVERYFTEKKADFRFLVPLAFNRFFGLPSGLHYHKTRYCGLILMAPIDLGSDFDWRDYLDRVERDEKEFPAYTALLLQKYYSCFNFHGDSDSLNKLYKAQSMFGFMSKQPVMQTLEFDLFGFHGEFMTIDSVLFTSNYNGYRTRLAESIKLLEQQQQPIISIDFTLNHHDQIIKEEKRRIRHLEARQYECARSRDLITEYSLAHGATQKHRVLKDLYNCIKSSKSMVSDTQHEFVDMLCSTSTDTLLKAIALYLSFTLFLKQGIEIPEIFLKAVQGFNSLFTDGKEHFVRDFWSGFKESPEASSMSRALKPDINKVAFYWMSQARSHLTKRIQTIPTTLSIQDDIFISSKSPYSCHQCKKRFPDTFLTCCQICKSAWYCGRVCQIMDWNVEHSKVCRDANDLQTGDVVRVHSLYQDGLRWNGRLCEVLDRRDRFRMLLQVKPYGQILKGDEIWVSSENVVRVMAIENQHSRNMLPFVTTNL
ncbi:hypothetical protein BDR26DRAFT_950061 [Obelidium mucronatum]|nr:hypothetical protein BDR26DRAFT_950061 [Obelidium mucronatum]